MLPLCWLEHVKRDCKIGLTIQGRLEKVKEFGPWLWAGGGQVRGCKLVNQTHLVVFSNCSLMKEMAVCKLNGSLFEGHSGKV